MDITTHRLSLRRLQIVDAPFILNLLNDPGWIEYIGDRNIRNIEDAQRYIITGPQAMYENHNFGLLLIQEKWALRPIGLAGLLQRDYLDAPDLGFALLGSEAGQGFAYEACKEILRLEFLSKGRTKLWAFTKPNNLRSQSLLLRLGFKVSPDKSLVDSDDVIYINVGGSYR